MNHPLDDHRIPGIGSMRRARLGQAGIHTLEALLAAETAVLTSLPGFNAAMVEQAQAYALQILNAPPPAPLPEIPDLPELQVPAPTPTEAETPSLTDESPHLAAVDEPPRASPGRLRRGLRIARRMAQVLVQVEEARKHRRSGPKVDRARVKRALAKLAHVLDQAQEQALWVGVRKREVAEVGERLDQLEQALAHYCAKSPTGKRSERLIDALRAPRKALGRS